MSLDDLKKSLQISFSFLDRHRYAPDITARCAMSFSKFWRNHVLIPKAVVVFVFGLVKDVVKAELNPNPKRTAIMKIDRSMVASISYYRRNGGKFVFLLETKDRKNVSFWFLLIFGFCFNSLPYRDTYLIKRIRTSMRVRNVRCRRTVSSFI